jgi:ATP-independent RNA helicase DbpA
MEQHVLTASGTTVKLGRLPRIPGKQVGKIAIFDFQAFVAVERALAKQAMQRLNSGKIKGRALKVRIV